MSASFSLALDTTAPVVTRGQPTFTETALRLPYTINEPGLESAVAIRSDGTEIEGTIESDRVLFTLDMPWAGGQIRLRTRDDVWNFREYLVDVPIINRPEVTRRTYTLGWASGLPRESVKEEFTRDSAHPNPMIYKRR